MKHKQNASTEGPGDMLMDLAQMNDQEVLRILHEIRQKQSIQQNQYTHFDLTQDNIVSNDYGHSVSDDTEDHDETHFSMSKEDRINNSNTYDSTLDDMGVEMLYDTSYDQDYIERNRPSPRNYNVNKKLSNQIPNEPTIPFEYSRDMDTKWGFLDDKYSVRLNDFCSNSFGCIGGGGRRYTNPTSSPVSKLKNHSRRRNLSEIRTSLIDNSLINKIRSKESSLIDDCATFDNDDCDHVDRSTIMDQYERINRGFVEKYNQRIKNLNKSSTPVHSGCQPMFQDILRRLTGMDEDDENNNAAVQHMKTQYGQNGYGVGILVENDDETKMTYDTYSTTSDNEYDNESKVIMDCQNYDTTSKYSPNYITASDDLTRCTDNYSYNTNDNSVFTARSHDTKSIYTNGEYTYGTSCGSTASDENDTLDNESQTEYTYDTVKTEKTR